MTRGKLIPLLEPMAQRWRALIVFHDGQEALLYVGRSHAQVKENYGIPWNDLFTDGERAETKKILLQKWMGAPDRGSWATQGELSVPDLRAVGT